MKSDNMSGNNKARISIVLLNVLMILGSVFMVKAQDKSKLTFFYIYLSLVLLLFLQYIHQRFSVPIEIALTTPLGEQSPRKRKIVGSSPTGSL